MGFFGKKAKHTPARKSRFAPVPGSAAGRGPFDVSELPPGTSGSAAFPLYNAKATSRGQFAAPGGNSRESQAIRARAYGQLIANRRNALPKKPQTILRHDKGLDAYNVSQLMDAYSAQYMRKRGVTEVDDLPFPDWDDEDLKEIPPNIIAGEVLRHINWSGHWRRDRSHHNKATEIAKKSLTPQMMQDLDQFYFKRLHRAKKYNGREFAEMAREFQQLFGPWPPGEAPWDISEQDLTDEEKKAARRMEQMSGIPYGGHIPDYTEGQCEWGRMASLQLPLERRNRVAMRALRPKANFVGPFRYPHRAHPVSGDGRAFGQKMKRPGGTILLDCSGSMSLTAEDINELLTHAPAALVACYASTGDTSLVNEQIKEQGFVALQQGTWRGRHGERLHDIDEENYANGVLVLAARDGRMADHNKLRRTLGGGNEVDGPALEWLATQAQPRIWVSDGGVTGRNEYAGGALVHDAMRIVRRGRIKQVLSVGDCIRLVKRMYEGEVGSARNTNKKYINMNAKR